MHPHRLSAVRVADRQLSVGGVVARSEEPQPGSDLALSLLDVLSYVADVLAFDQEQVEAEGFLETSYDRENGVVAMGFPVDRRPLACLVIDSDSVYVATVGSQTGDSTVRFGEGAHGGRPPEGFEKVAAVYRHGDGATGTLELRGLGLSEPFWLIAFGHRGKPVGCIRLPRSR